MVLLLFSLMLLNSTDAYKHFSKSGHEAVCLVNYQDKTIKCDYKNMHDCREQYSKVHDVICFNRKDLKLKGE